MALPRRTALPVRFLSPNARTFRQVGSAAVSTMPPNALLTPVETRAQALDQPDKSAATNHRRATSSHSRLPCAARSKPTLLLSVTSPVYPSIGPRLNGRSELPGRVEAGRPENGRS